MAWLFALVFAVPIMAYRAWAHGYVAAKLWTWFLVPVGLRAQSWTLFSGVWLLFVLLTSLQQNQRQKDEREDTEKVLTVLLWFAGPWLTLLVGWWLS